MENLAQDCGSQWYREGTGLVSSYCFNLARRTTKNGRRSTFVLLPEGRPDHSSKRLALASFGNDRAPGFRAGAGEVAPRYRDTAPADRDWTGSRWGFCSRICAPWRIKSPPATPNKRLAHRWQQCGQHPWRRLCQRSAARTDHRSLPEAALSRHRSLARVSLGSDRKSVV